MTDCVSFTIRVRGCLGLPKARHNSASWPVINSRPLINHQILNVSEFIFYVQSTKSFKRNSGKTFTKTQSNLLTSLWLPLSVSLSVSQSLSVCLSLALSLSLSLFLTLFPDNSRILQMIVQARHFLITPHQLLHITTSFAQTPKLC